MVRIGSDNGKKEKGKAKKKNEKGRKKRFALPEVETHLGLFGSGSRARDRL